MAAAVIVAQGGDVEIQGEYLSVVVRPAEGGVLEEFALLATGRNLAGADGLVQEGFGAASLYVPNRRLNEQLEVLDHIPDRPILRYSYDCEGSNIRGLHATRLVEPLRDEASVRVRWRIEHKGDEAQWVAPWVRNEVAPGGAFDATDRFDAPTPDGILNVRQSGYHPAARNWIAVTDPTTRETLYGVFHADHVHSFLVMCDIEEKRGGFQTAFGPRLMRPGDVWETTYRINAVRGLSHVDFATDQLAAQLDYRGDRLEVLLASVKPLSGLHIRASIRGADDHVWKLPEKRFDIHPDTLVRCTYPWTAPADGVYEFLAQLRHGDQVLNLGTDTGPPHGGMDTQFVVGKPARVTMEPWTNAPYVLDRGPRTLQRRMAVSGDTAVWFESSLEKIFREDVPEPVGPPDPTARVALARNESESFQLVLRPPKDQPLRDINVQLHDLEHTQTAAKLSASNISASRVAYIPIRVPSLFEGPTGNWPDALPRLEPFEAPGGQCSPVWFTVYAPRGTPPGKYVGLLEVTSADLDPLDLWLEVTVHDFDLPITPALKTDFRFWTEEALHDHKAKGGNRSPEQLQDAYMNDALRHRVTLRELVQMPSAGPDYTGQLKRFEPRLSEAIRRGAATVCVPASLLDAPDNLKAADAFAAGLKGRAFCQIADVPMPPAWPLMIERIQQWRKTAPNIPLMATTAGLQPFLPEELDIWCVHLPVLDTHSSRAILERTAQGREVWWFVNHSPPRPYGNFFIDFAAIEHRMIFWQTWALGMKGFHYWCINFAQAGRNPWVSQLDITPTNGNGFLVYPGKDGPVSSIRWETIRDGIEDYDYLMLLRERMGKLQKLGGHGELLKRAEVAADLKDLVPNLVAFPRDPSVLLTKRATIADLIVKLGKATQ